MNKFNILNIAFGFIFLVGLLTATLVWSTSVSVDMAAHGVHKSGDGSINGRTPWNSMAAKGGFPNPGNGRLNNEIALIGDRCLQSYDLKYGADILAKFVPFYGYGHVITTMPDEELLQSTTCPNVNGLNNSLKSPIG
jgi:hypothetical protein